MATTFVAVDNGNRADGYLVANGDAYVARSGGFGRGEIPQGTYKLGAQQNLNPGKKQNRSMADGSKNWRNFKKFAISGVGPSAQSGGIRDPRYPKAPRTGVMFHYDGNTKGSEGCIAYDDPAAQRSLAAAQGSGDTEVHVIYVKTDAEARALATKLAGEAPPANTVRGYGKAGGSELAPTGRRSKKTKRKKKKPARRRTAQLSGDTSTIQSGARMAQGEPSVLLGKKMLVAAHVQARHTGGGRIAEGSNSVYVGKQLLAFGRVTDPTTDGSEVATGEPSVMVG